MRLRKAKDMDQKQDMLWKIEKLNIFIQEFGGFEPERVYNRKKEKGNRF